MSCWTPAERINAVLADKAIDRETRDRLVPELLNVFDIVLTEQLVRVSRAEDSTELIAAMLANAVSRQRSHEKYFGPATRRGVAGSDSH